MTVWRVDEVRLLTRGGTYHGGGEWLVDVGQTVADGMD
jgi:hypothetical protein